MVATSGQLIAASLVLLVAAVLHGQSGQPDQPQQGLLDRLWQPGVASSDELIAPRRGPAVARLSLYIDNDSAYLKPNDATDRWYTSGVAVTITDQPRYGEEMARFMPFGEQFGPAVTAVGVAMGSLMFTPRDIEARNPDPRDHPYAGYNFVGVFWQRADPQLTTMDHFEVDLGWVGPCAGGRHFQQNIHNLIGSTDPRGWDYQLGNEVTIQTFLRKKWRVELWRAGGDDGPFAIELIPSAGLALGTVYRHLEGDLLLRMGWNLPLDFGPGRINDWQSAMQPLSEEGLSFYVFGRAGGQIVQHNLFLNGNTFQNSRSVTPEVFVGEAQAGLTTAWRKGNLSFEVTYSQTFQTKQFTTQKAMHSYGSWVFSLALAY